MLQLQLSRERRLSALLNRLPVTALRIVWIAAILWYELGISYQSVDQCKWPDDMRSGDTIRFIVVADPQILDTHSYPGWSPTLAFLSRLFVDLNLRKNWHAALRTRPDAVVFLGDMMDGGRLAISHEEYEAYHQRFKSIFKVDVNTPIYYVPGNRDIGLGVSSLFSEHARDRYKTHFGALNRQISMRNFTIVLLDSPGLAEEDYLRRGKSVDYDHWEPVPGETVDFIKSITPDAYMGSVVLFSHISLSRPDDTHCGADRETGTIRANVGFGFQNTLSPAATEFILRHIEPSIVFSGGDHDYCEYTHIIPSPSGSPITVREVSIKSLSMAMGIRRPGFQLLSVNHAASSRLTSHMLSDRPCFLPDQVNIYLSIYIPLFAFTLIILLSANVYRTRVAQGRRATKTPRMTLDDSDIVMVSSAPFAGRDGRRRLEPQDDIEEQWTHVKAADEEDSMSLISSPSQELETALHPGQDTPQHAVPSTWPLVLFAKRHRFRVPRGCLLVTQRFMSCLFGRRGVSKLTGGWQRGLLGGFLCDVRDVTGVAAGVFALTAGYLMVY